MTVEQIVQQALQLPAEARAQIVDQIERSLSESDPEIDRIWGQEALRRLAALDAGRGRTYTMEEVFGKD